MAVRSEAAKAIEAILMVAQEPVETHLLAQLLEIAPGIVDEICDQLATDYEQQGRGFELVRVAGGLRFQSRAELAPYVERFVLEGQSSRLSAAALETLAIVAYKQPISRAQIAAIRGVNVDGVMRTLVHRGYLEELGRDPGPGQAVLFGTSREFLERLGLDSLDDLPPIAELFPDATVMEALERGLRADPPADAATVGDGDGDGGEHRDGPRVHEDTEFETGVADQPLIDLDAPVEDIPVPSWAVETPPDPPDGDDPRADRPGE